MRYIFNEDLDKSIEERILQLNNVEKQDIELSNFEIDYNLEIINRFKEKLLSDKDKKFFIVGDYDCDGICATTIIKRLLDELNIENNYYIPSRTKEGYGINDKIVQTAYDNNFDCILCVDNGVVASNQLAKAKKLGIKTYIIDHHEYTDTPECDGFLHPNIFPNEYKDMCAAGICALLSNSFRQDELTTVYGGLATLADMVSIFSYNRYLVKQMLNILSNTRIEPINLLLGSNEITYTNLQYNVIPKINAVSRLDDLMNVNYVVRYLLSTSNECLKYYDKIEIINESRKQISKTMYQDSLRLIDDSKNIIIIKNEHFKEGLCGIVANRLLDIYDKPVVVFAENNDILKGSGRSKSGTNLFEYLKECKDLFDNYGGHEQAVGITISEDNYVKLLEYVDKHPLSINEQYTDVLLFNQEDIDFSILNQINSLGPYGVGFKEPLIGIRNPKYIKRLLVAGKYPKFIFNDKFDAISFNSNMINKDFEYMIGKLKMDTYNSNKLSFVIEDLV